MIKKAFFLFVFGLSFLFANKKTSDSPFPLFAIPENELNSPFYLLTIPKSGHYLGLKLLDMLKVPYESSHVGGHHFNWIYDWESFFARNPNYKIILMIRDPRDVLVSFIRWALEEGHRYAIPYDVWEKLDFDAQLVSLIEGHDVKTKRFHREFFAAKKWLNDPKAFMIRFENIVGEKEGESKEKQVQTIRDLAQFLEIELSEKRIEEIYDNLWGGTATFHKGTTGQWKEKFTEEHVRLFKEYLGQYLIDFGYEKDFNWGLDEAIQAQ